MAHWYAQTFNFSIHDMPLRAPPAHFDGRNLEWGAVKGKLTNFLYGQAPEQRVYRTFHENEKASLQGGDKLESRGFGGVRNAGNKEWMKDPYRLKPFAYPISRKNLTPAIKLHPESLPDRDHLRAERRREKLEQTESRRAADIKARGIRNTDAKEPVLSKKGTVVSKKPSAALKGQSSKDSFDDETESHELSGADSDRDDEGGLGAHKAKTEAPGELAPLEEKKNGKLVKKMTFVRFEIDNGAETLPGQIEEIKEEPEAHFESLMAPSRQAEETHDLPAAVVSVIKG